MLRRSIAVLALTIPLLCGATAEARQTTQPGKARCLSQSQVDRVRNHLVYAPRLFRACDGWVEKVMRSSRLRPNRDTTRAVLAMALAHRFAPYGPSGGWTYRELAFLPTHDA